MSKCIEYGGQHHKLHGKGGNGTVVCFKCSEAGHISKIVNVVRKHSTHKGITVNKINILALIDTGSEYNKTNRSKTTSLSDGITPCYVRINGVCTRVLRGMTSTALIIDDIKFTVDLYIADEDIFPHSKL